MFDLEKEEGFKFPDTFEKNYSNITQKYNCFLSEIPLLIIERYYIEHKANLNKYVMLEYQDKELQDIKIIELYNYLEEFYNEIFFLATRIANYYNLEIKIGNQNNNLENTNYA